MSASSNVPARSTTLAAVPVMLTADGAAFTVGGDWRVNEVVNDDFPPAFCTRTVNEFGPDARAMLLKWNAPVASDVVMAFAWTRRTVVRALVVPTRLTTG